MSSHISLSVSEQPDPPEQRGQTTSSGPGCPPIQPFFQPVPVPVYIGQHGGWSTSQYGQGQAPGSYRGPPFRPGQKTGKIEIILIRVSPRNHLPYNPHTLC